MNNSARLFTFVILSTLIMLTAASLQNRINPQPPADLVEKLDEQAPADNAAAQDSDKPQTSEPANGDGEIEEAKKKKPSPPTDAALTAEPKVEDAKPATTEAPVTEPEQAPPENKLVTLGSLNPSSGYRFLVTFNSEGGAIQRVELNAQNRKGRLKYRDLEVDGGYIGHLNGLENPSGCEVQTVGDGTPAALAGIQPGDVITSLGGTPVTSPADLSEMLGETKPGQELSVKFLSDGNSKTATIKLTNTPIEVVRPEPDVLDPGFDFPESFLMTLRKPVTGGDWPELDNQMKTANWNVVEKTTDDNQSVTFTYSLNGTDKFGEKWKLSTYKRYWLEKLTPELSEDFDSRSWHLNMEIGIVNDTDKAQKIAYELDGPTGTPSEGWWYQMKIHGRSSAIGKIAGARDIVAGSDGAPYTFFSGPEIASNSRKTIPKRQYLFNPEYDPEFQKVNFIGVDTQYFNSVLIPDHSNGEFHCYSALAWHTGAEVPKASKDQKLVDVTPMMFTKVELAPAGKYSQKFEIFCGPKDPDILENYGLSDTRTFGWFAWVSQGLCKLLEILYWATFKISYGIPIILLTVLVRLIMIPFSRRAALNAQMMQHLQPQIKEIADKYKDDMEKRAQAQRDLFKRHNYNPFGGCFMGLFQLPIFLGLYRGLSVDVALRDQPLIPGVEWCSNLAAPDQFMNWTSWMPSFISDQTGWLGPYLNLLPLITIVLFIVQQKMFTPPATDENQKMMQKAMMFAMIFMGVIFFKVPSGLCLYFITTSIWSIIEKKMLPKPVLDTSKLALDGAVVSETTAPIEEKVFSNDAAVEQRKRRDRERKKRLKKRGD